MNHKTLSEFRVGHGAVLEGLLVDSFAALLKTGVASLDRVAVAGLRRGSRLELVLQFKSVTPIKRLCLF